MEVDQDEHLAVSLHGRPHGQAGDLGGLADRDGRTLALDSHQVGMGARQCLPARLAGAVAAVWTQQGGGEGPGRRSLPRPGGAHEQVGVHRLAGGTLELGDGLLLTDDGGMAYRLTHPRYRVAKEYEAVVAGVPASRQLKTLRDGVGLEAHLVQRFGYSTDPAEAHSCPGAGELNFHDGDQNPLLRWIATGREPGGPDSETGTDFLAFTRSRDSEKKLRIARRAFAGEHNWSRLQRYANFASRKSHDRRLADAILDRMMSLRRRYLKAVNAPALFVEFNASHW